MNKEAKLINAVLEAAKEKDGRRQLPCAEAFRLAAVHEGEIRRIGQICNENNIRITNCQLGCFR